MKNEKKELNKILGGRIRAARKENGLIQSELAAMVGIASRETLSDIENGIRSIRPGEILLFAHALGKTTNYFADPGIASGDDRFLWLLDEKRKGAKPRDMAKFELSLGRQISALPTSPLKTVLRLNQFDMNDEADIERGMQELASKFLAELGLNALTLSAKVIAELGLTALSLSAMAEKVGIPVLMIDAQAALISGNFHSDKTGVVMVNKNATGENQLRGLVFSLFRALTWDELNPHILAGSYQTKSWLCASYFTNSVIVALKTKKAF